MEIESILRNYFCHQMKQSLKPIYYWLLTGCTLIGLMVIIGGITRLTQSGLSMVDWKLFMGAIPPLSMEAWEATFEKYKAFPEYQIVNSNFSLNDFKAIFWWEYIHRNLGRLIGIVFIIPFIIFLVQKRVDAALLKKLIVLFLLGAFQGFLGWFMVKSGLVNDPHVSHYRLAAHLFAAFAAFGYSFWLALEIRGSEVQNRNSGNLIYIGFSLLIIQIIYGAFVAGLKAGLYYNTWPLMAGQIVPTEFYEGLTREGLSALFTNITAVQFIHRTLGIAVLALVVALWVKARHIQGQEKAATFLLVFVCVQFVFGVLTILLKVPIMLGVLHQFGALVLFAGFIYLIHSNRTTRG